MRKETSIATGVVGLITGPQQAEDIIANGQADIVLLARQESRDFYWPRRAAKELAWKYKCRCSITRLVIKQAAKTEIDVGAT